MEGGTAFGGNPKFQSPITKTATLSSVCARSSAGYPPSLLRSYGGQGPPASDLPAEALSALIGQRIDRQPPKLDMQVRFLLRAPFFAKLGFHQASRYSAWQSRITI